MSLALLCGSINLPLSIAHCDQPLDHNTNKRKKDFLKFGSKLFFCTQVCFYDPELLSCLAKKIAQCKKYRHEKQQGNFSLNFFVGIKDR